MKKRLAVVLCAAMMLSACGGASASDQAADTNGQAAADSKADATEGSKGDGKAGPFYLRTERRYFRG